jgi:predicted outer membrane repeat protein
MKTSSLANLRVICATVIAFVLVTLSAEMMTPRARAFFVLTVTSTADSGPGSLRDTVAGASSGDTIMFNLSPPATITLTTGEIAIAKTLTIDGPGAASLTISGNNASRIFNIASGVTLKVSGLTVADGSVTGAGFVGNITNTGGAIYNAGVLGATNCTFSGNHASVYGGAIQNFGAASFTGCSFLDNTAGTEAGGISDAGTGTVSVSNCTFNGNSADTGGAIYGVGQVFVNNSTFTSNSSRLDGGAIFNTGSPDSQGGSMSIANSTFIGNSAGTCACAAGNGGAINNIGQVSIANCTFNGNSAGPSGGAIYNKRVGLSAVTTIINCTLSGNSAASGGGFYGTGGANSGTLNMENTIIANSTGGDCMNLGLTGSNSHNLIQDATCSPFLSGDPMLGPIGNYGGPTQTMALLPGSPAIDAGDNSVRGAPLFLTHDQRGVPRCHVDIGAYEVAEAVPPPTVICPANISVFSDPGASTALVSFGATATDVCDGQITPVFKIGSNVITSPHAFPGGTTTVTAFATDLLNITGMCSFTVTVTVLDICIQDDHTGDTFRFSSQTGAYLYTRCRDKFTLSGTGSIKVVNNIVMLTDSRPDRKISAGFNLGQLTGRANVTLIIGPGMYVPITVFQTNPHPTCVCP